MIRYAFQKAPRCHARSKRTKQPCRNPAMRGWKVCRNHGAFGGAKKGNVNALKHGRYSAEMIAARRLVRELLSEARDLVRHTTTKI